MFIGTVSRESVYRDSVTRKCLYIGQCHEKVFIGTGSRESVYRDSITRNYINYRTAGKFLCREREDIL